MYGSLLINNGIGQGVPTMVTVKMDGKGSLMNNEGILESGESIMIKYSQVRGRVRKIFIGAETEENCALTIEYDNIHQDITSITPGPAAYKIIMHIGMLVIKTNS